MGDGCLFGAVLRGKIVIFVDRATVERLIVGGVLC
jgi:hypothetical protein